MSKMTDKLKSDGLKEVALYVETLERMVEDLVADRDRYKKIIDDIAYFGCLRPKTIEDIRDLGQDLT